MLEFYPHHRLPFRAVPIFPSLPLQVRPLRAFVVAALVVAAAGCATTAPRTGATLPGSSGTPATSTAEPPPPNVNLSGFPLPYRQGYADGCASVTGAERKDTLRFAADGNYRTGWQDGLAICRKK
jgi:hypothetical protein